MDEKYLYPVPAGRWLISRFVDDRWISLHEDNPLFDSGDAEVILQALRIPVTERTLNLHFPLREGLGRCPTLALLELCNALDSTNPHVKNKKMVGV